MNVFNSSEVTCKGNSNVKMQISTSELFLSAAVSDNMINDVKVILGIDVMHVLGKVVVTRYTVQFSKLGRYVVYMLIADRG